MKMKLVQLFLVFIMSIGFSTINAQSTLFNGIDLAGWQVHGTEKWYVDQGDLICESGPDKEYGYLSTIKAYKNFVLKLSFKQEANGNSGVFFRSSVKGVIIKGWQVEVAPPGQHTGGIYESYGRGWLIKPNPKNEKYLKMEDWNQLRIKVKGDQVTTYLNGHKMIQLQDEKIGAGEGSIALQIHSGGGIKVRWNNFKIREL